ncbi:MAG: type II toxin-antitoxin system HipA family toxin [Acidimicrobiia bacterium]|nr:type II toxin-antitoxin system HipA family toxin [Acidimicrobiia bacterium]
MSYQPVDVIEVSAWGERVGAVALDPTTSVYAFEYTPEWIASGIELAPLHMPLRSGVFEFPELSRETFLGLPAMLADALPDKFGNAVVDAWMAEQGLSTDRITALDRLAYAADRAMGALEFRPPMRDTSTEEPTAVVLADLVVAARRALTGELSGHHAAHDALAQLVTVGTSAGGARAKAVLAFNPTTWQVRSAHADMPEGFEHWLIKLDGVSGSVGLDGHGDRLGESAPYGRIEYAYYLMATGAGIEMADCRLLAEGPRRHFMTRRFDREAGGRRHHLMSLCAMAHLDFNLTGVHSYDQYLETVRRLGLSPNQIAQAYRRMVFNVSAVNRDDHTKNLAFLLPERGRWQLAPAFDVTHAYRPDSPWTSKHLMSVNGRFDEIALSDLHAVAERHDVPGYKRIIREVADAIDRWPHYAEQAELDAVVTAEIAKDMDRFRPS